MIFGVILALRAHLRAIFSPVALGVCAVAQDEQGRVLLVRHSYIAGWHLPGGGVERRERPQQAILRELKEEVGLLSSDAPELIGVYMRKLEWIDNAVVLYRVKNARIDFKPNLEVREILFVDPQSPPADIAPAARRRLAELSGKAPPSPDW